MIKKLEVLIKNIYLLVLKPSKVFKRPNKTDIIIYDREGSSNVLPYFKNYNYEILDVRGESLNIYILFKTILKRRISFIGYVTTYLEVTSPKVVITFIDNAFIFYKIKYLYPLATTMFMQNGFRSGRCDVFYTIEEKKKNFPNIEVDYMFVFDKNIGNEYKKYLKGEAIVSGSFKCNEYYKDKEISKLDKKIILFPSEYRYHKSSSDIMYEDVLFKDFYMAEKILLPMLKKYCIENSYELVIAGSSDGKDGNEYKFYENILGQDGWHIKSRNNIYSSYESILNAYGVVYIDSTLGYESLAIKKRTCAFSARENFINDINHSFCWASDLGRKGKFWTDEITQAEFNRVIQFVFESKDNIWDETLQEIHDDLIVFDKGNKTFTSIIENILKEDIS